MHESIGTFHTRIRQRTQKEQDLLCSFLALVHSIHFLTTGEREEEESLGTVLHDTQGTCQGGLTKNTEFWCLSAPDLGRTAYKP
jgi:hypothetical protein